MSKLVGVDSLGPQQGRQAIGPLAFLFCPLAFLFCPLALLFCPLALLAGQVHRRLSLLVKFHKTQKGSAIGANQSQLIGAQVELHRSAGTRPGLPKLHFRQLAGFGRSHPNG
jgi:hypothetical protein